MRFVLTIILLLTNALHAADRTPPPTGNYVFTQVYELTNCAEFEDTRGPIAHCKRTETKKFKIGEEIKVDQFFFDDKSDSFGAKYVHLGTNRSIPLNVIKLKTK